MALNSTPNELSAYQNLGFGRTSSQFKECRARRGSAHEPDVGFLPHRAGESQRVHVDIGSCGHLGQLLGSYDNIAILGSMDVDHTFHLIIREKS